MMSEQEYDRLERLARLWCEAALRSNRESRKQLMSLNSLVDKRNKLAEARMAREKSSSKNQT